MQADQRERHVGADQGAGRQLHARLGVGELDDKGAVGESGLDFAVDRLAQQRRDGARKGLLARVDRLLGGLGRRDARDGGNKIAGQHQSTPAGRIRCRRRARRGVRSICC